MGSEPLQASDELDIVSALGCGLEFAYIYPYQVQQENRE